MRWLSATQSLIEPVRPILVRQTGCYEDVPPVRPREFHGIPEPALITGRKEHDRREDSLFVLAFPQRKFERSEGGDHARRFFVSKLTADMTLQPSRRATGAFACRHVDHSGKTRPLDVPIPLGA